MIRLLVCGDREWKDGALIRRALVRLGGREKIQYIIHGACHGADTLADGIAKRMYIPRLSYSAQWTKYGRSAGPIRNGTMLKEGRPTHVIAFHDNIEKSKGTANMLKQARGKRIPTHIISHQCPEIPSSFLES